MLSHIVSGWHIVVDMREVVVRFGHQRLCSWNLVVRMREVAGTVVVSLGHQRLPENIECQQKGNSLYFGRCFDEVGNYAYSHNFCL